MTSTLVGDGYYFFFNDLSGCPDMDDMISFNVCRKDFFNSHGEMECVFFEGVMPDDYDQSGSSAFMTWGKTIDDVRSELVSMGFEEGPSPRVSPRP